MGMQKGIEILTMLQLQPCHYLCLCHLAGTIQRRDDLFEQQPLQLVLGGWLLGLEVLRERIRNGHQDFHSSFLLSMREHNAKRGLVQCWRSVTPMHQWPRLRQGESAERPRLRTFALALKSPGGAPGSRLSRSWGRSDRRSLPPCRPPLAHP